MKTSRPPFWYPASNYYVLAIAFSTAMFFLIWGVLNDEGDEAPWVAAGISSSVLVIGAVVLRGMIVRRVQSRYALPRVPYEDRVPRRMTDNGRDRQKLTIERNSAILFEIRKKSEAAQILNKLSAGHREVFELCSEYIERNEAELKDISPSSPRLTSLLKGRTQAAELHRYHLLRWAEIESQNLASESQTSDDPEKRIGSANDALRIVQSALMSYPADESLLASKAVLEENVVFVKVADRVDQAEKAAYQGDYTRARAFYKDALFYLSRDNVQSGSRAAVAEHINAELDKIANAGDAH